jgi:hypothetical protein
MTNRLTLANILYHLHNQIADMQHRQILNEAHPDYGAVIFPAYGIADPKASGIFVVGCGYLWLGQPETHQHLLKQANLAADYLLRAQRPSGLIDLLSVNYDSSPDTGFTVQQLCTLFELGRNRIAENWQWAGLLQKLALFIRRAVGGMLDGGFHTPNHRWVIVSALVQAKQLFPDLEVKATVEAYLAEGIDIDAEGAFIERSVGVYDAVNNRSLLLIAENWACLQAIEAVQRSLNFDLHLLHADGTAETGLSRRQDYGARTVPLGLAPCLLLSHHVNPNPVFAQAAQWLWQQSSIPKTHPETHLDWLCYALLKCGDPQPTAVSLPEDFARYYPLNGLWRVRRGLLSASFFQGVTRLLTLTFGEAELSSLKISQTYFGQYIGRFVSDALEVENKRAVLRSEGLANPRRPGYELPLGRPVPPERWSDMLPERSLRRLPPAKSVLTVEEVEGGFDLRYQTLAGLDGVTAQIAFDFPPGGIWETQDTRLQPQAGQVIFLKQGYGAMRYGNDVIRLGPGADAHATWQMRDAETAPDHARVLFTFRTPIDFSFSLRAYRGL